MTANTTGRTISRFTDMRVDDSSGTLRSIPVDSINGVGLDYEQIDLTAFQDAVKGSLPALPSCTITVTGPFSTDAAASAGTLSGSHTILNNLPGGVTPLSLGVFLGMRHTWEAGEPTFGLSSSATSGFLCKKYDVKDGKYSAEFVVYPGSSVPAWTTAAIT